jgi:hypothetical protein
MLHPTEERQRESETETQRDEQGADRNDINSLTRTELSCPTHLLVLLLGTKFPHEFSGHTQSTATPRIHS